MDYKTENYKILKPLLDNLNNSSASGLKQYCSAEDFASIELEKKPLYINFLLRESHYEELVREYFFLNVINGTASVVERNIRNSAKEVLKSINKDDASNDKDLNKYLKQI